jgi:hypothetical protein
VDLDAVDSGVPAHAFSPDSLVAATASLVKTALRIADTQVQEACSGTMLPYSPQSLHRGCPSSPEILLVSGRPRIVDGQCISGGTNQRGYAIGKACASIRAVITSIGPYGFSIAVFDYEFEREGEDRWRLVRRVFTAIVE